MGGYAPRGKGAQGALPGVCLPWGRGCVGLGQGTSGVKPQGEGAPGGVSPTGRGQGEAGGGFWRGFPCGEGEPGGIPPWGGTGRRPWGQGGETPGAYPPQDPTPCIKGMPGWGLSPETRPSLDSPRLQPAAKTQAVGEFGRRVVTVLSPAEPPPTPEPAPEPPALPRSYLASSTAAAAPRPGRPGLPAPPEPPRPRSRGRCPLCTTRSWGLGQSHGESG